MFSAQQYSNSRITDILGTLSPYSDSDMITINKSGIATNSNITNLVAIQPIITIKKKVGIASGNGYENSPYELTEDQKKCTIIHEIFGISV